MTRHTKQTSLTDAAPVVAGCDLSRMATGVSVEAPNSPWLRPAQNNRKETR